MDSVSPSAHGSRRSSACGKIRGRRERIRTSAFAAARALETRPHGDLHSESPIKLAIGRDTGSFQLKLVSPANTRATVCIPLAACNHTAIRANGRPLWLNGKPNGRIPGISPAGDVDGDTRFTFEPGVWDFEGL